MIQNEIIKKDGRPEKSEGILTLGTIFFRAVFNGVTECGKTNFKPINRQLDYIQPK